MRYRRKEYPHDVVAQLETWQLSYYLSSEESWRDSYFSELLEVSAKVLYSGNKKIPVDSIINLYIVVYHNMKNFVDKPKLVSVFNNSRKERKCGFTVHPSFLDSFAFHKITSSSQITSDSSILFPDYFMNSISISPTSYSHNSS